MAQAVLVIVLGRSRSIRYRDLIARSHHASVRRIYKILLVVHEIFAGIE